MDSKQPQDTKKPAILITGASGFIGSFIVEEALRKGMDVWAAVRKSTNRKYLKDERIHFIELNLSSEKQLTEALSTVHFDYIVHAAGATKCLNAEDFFRINTEGTKNLVRAVQATQPLFTANAGEKPRFVYVSSLSIFGPIREQRPYTEILDTDTPQPNTAYGKSKLEAEEWLKQQESLPYVVLRPTGVYGPRETDYFIMAKSIKQHSDFAVGYTPQDITFVYVKDVVQAVFRSMEHAECWHKAYFLSDGEVYNSRTFSDLIQKELGVKFLLRITAPVWVLRIVTAIGDKWGHITGKLSALNNDKYNILRQRNWRCDITPARRDFGFTPEYQLERGVKEAIAWYKENGWL